MQLTNMSNRLDYLDLYEVQVTPIEARSLLNIIRRLNPEKLLAGEVLDLNNLTNQLEKIANE